MLEESKMDKKLQNRSSQPQSRASSSDCKKSTDLTHKPWPRNNNKREGNGGASKNEPYRKNGPTQRGRGQIDRRPRARGNPGYAMGGAEITGIEDTGEPEIGSVCVPGSKKQNLNHLLNFMYPTRGGTGSERRGPPIRRQAPQRLPHRFDHDLYLRAYCQFVVKEDGDYVINLMDPDVPVKWELIEEIVVRSTGKSECPICLGSPVAGRVGLCGHVYCWACVLHYAAAHEKQPPPCPVCTTPIIVKDMKPTKMVQWESPSEEVTMRLVRRQRGSTVVEIAPPRGQLTECKEPTVLPLESLNSAPYSKLFAASKQQVRDILEREKKEIQDQIFAEIDTTEIVYLEQALELLKQKEINLNSQFKTPKIAERKHEEEPVTVYEKQEETGPKMDWFDVTDEGATCIEIINEKMGELDVASIESGQCQLNPDAPEFTANYDNSPTEFPLVDDPVEIEEDLESTITDIDKQNQSKYFYFYQAEDGQQVFLNSLNVRILNASWGALAAAPAIIRGRVLHRETLPLNEQTRKHMPYTAHLPLNCAFDIVELELKPPYVTMTAINNFADEIERRSRIRAKAERDERRRERAYRRAMEGPPKPDFSSEVLFPPAPPSNFIPIPQEPASPLPDQASSSTSSTAMSPGLSFAKMAGAGASCTWRVRNKAAAPPTPPSDDDDEGAAPRFVLADAIEAALHATPSTSSKKNKKSKQKVLFTTGLQRSA